MPLLHQARSPKPAVHITNNAALRARFSLGLRPQKQCRAKDAARNIQVRSDPTVSYIILASDDR